MVIIVAWKVARSFSVSKIKASKPFMEHVHQILLDRYLSEGNGNQE